MFIMWLRCRFLLLGWATILSVSAQELYPLNEPASTMPRGVLGIRVSADQFKEVARTRSLYALRFMYGVTPRLTVLTNLTMSNHHNRLLPEDLITHTHLSNGQTNYFTHNIQRGVKYPFLFNGVHVLAKYRFLSIDGKNEHLRMAWVGEWSSVRVAHDEAEPNLVDDTGGYGTGIIATWLKNRFAASFTYGIIRPNKYFEKQPDYTGGPDLPTTIFYGNGSKFNLSLGYLIYPKKYTSYEDPNWNLYVEFQGKRYGAATVIQNGTAIGTDALALVGGYYWEVHPGIQRIVNSNFRMDLTVGFSLINRSYVQFTPVWMFAVQRYFYRK
jgi:hypothetical protein